MSRQNFPMLRHLQSPISSSAAAAAVPSSSLDSRDAEGETLVIFNTAPPTLSQLNALIALPVGMANASSRGQRGGRARKQKGRLVREGEIFSKMFDAYGARPQPRNGLSLEQSITMELEYATQGILTAGSAAGQFSGAAVVVALSAFGAASSLTAVFDQYRFEQLEVWIEVPNVNGALVFPELYTAVDLDDGNVPTTTSGVSDRQGALVSTGPGGHYHKWRPHMAVATYSGTFTSYANMQPMWIDSASPNVQHYGLKLAAVSAGNALLYNAVVRAVVSFRAPAIN